MTRDELTRETARRTGYTIAVCNEIIKETFDVMVDELIGHGEVKIPRFGRLFVTKAASRNIRLPSGELQHYEGAMVPKMKFSDVVRDGVKAK